MELGRIKDQLDTVLEEMEKVKPGSEEFRELGRRRDELIKVISDEESRRSKEALKREKQAHELEYKEIELSERRKDRWVKIGLAAGAGLLSIASIWKDNTAMICDAGWRYISNVKRVFH